MTDQLSASAFETYKAKANEDLWSIAYEHVLPPGSPASVERCVNNIMLNNDYDAIKKGILQIPKPCDPEDAKVLERKQAESNQKSSSTEVDSLKSKTDRLSTRFNSGDIYESADALASELSTLIDTLKTDKREYNHLIEQLFKTTQNQSPDGAKLSAQHWNKETNTWDKLLVFDKNYPASSPLRIVQPGNTFEQIVQDRVVELAKQGIKVNQERFLKSMKTANAAIQDTGNLKPGTIIEFPY